ncbi:MAG: hypothetical protein ACYC99_12160 [Candidatus Geothermincolia bacterium]
MPPEPGQVFAVMAAAYRHGVLDKTMSMFGEALGVVMTETSINTGDLVNMLDEAQESSVLKVERLLARSKLLLKLAAHDSVMAFASRALESPAVKLIALRVTSAMLLRGIDGERPPRAPMRLKPIVARLLPGRANAGEVTR